MKESKVDFCVRDLEGALVVATEAGIAACIRDLARAVAREEIERANHGGDTDDGSGLCRRGREGAPVLGSDGGTGGPTGRSSDRGVASVGASPTGVRVRVTEEALDAMRDKWPATTGFRQLLKAAAPHMEVMVDLGELWGVLADEFGVVVMKRHVKGVARHLGLTLTEGDSDA